MDPFIGQIIMFGGNFAPRGWAFCDGQLLAISSNTALFSILGTTYGGDGRTSFGLPDLRGRAPKHAGRGPGLSDYRLGSKGGQEQFTLLQNNLPSFDVPVLATTDDADSDEPGDTLVPGVTDDLTYSSGTPDTNLEPARFRGQNLPINKQSPYTTINFIIALQGTFPSRS